MAKRGVKSAGDAEPSQTTDESSSSTPAPPGKLHVSLTAIAKGVVLHRVHQSIYQSDQFNPGIQGNARFSPIQDERGNPIPILYCGTTVQCALMETIFHDVPHSAGFKSFDKGKLARQVHSTIQIERELQLVDLTSVSLRKLGVMRKQLIDTEKSQYPATRSWAAAIHDQCPKAQGLFWVSRQDDSACAVVLFGDRIPDGALRSIGISRSLLGDADAYDVVLDLADRIGVNLVQGKL